MRDTINPVSYTHLDVYKRQHIGTHLEFTSVAQADDIGKTKENGFEDGEYQYSLYGNVVENESDAMTEDEDEGYFNSDTLFDLNKELKETIKCPFFILNGVPDGYTLTEAVYGKLHRNISYRIQWENQYIYVSQQMQVCLLYTSQKNSRQKFFGRQEGRHRKTSGNLGKNGAVTAGSW